MPQPSRNLGNQLRPARAVHYDKPNYRSKFHRFVELVLTAVEGRRQTRCDWVQNGIYLANLTYSQRASDALAWNSVSHANLPQASVAPVTFTHNPRG
jgi:hypothetical protein